MASELLGLFTKESQPVPLTGVSVKGKMTGRGARVRVIQAFKNMEGRPVEAVYKFPLPEGSAVSGFKAVVGDRVIEGAIEERDKAFESYDEAMARGDGAYLLDEERPNIFTLSVGNLNPGVTALIEIDYVTLLDVRASEVRFFLPTTISPRYIPERTPDESGIPVDHLVNPVYGLDVPYGLSILMEVHGKEEISSIESPSHQVSLTFDPDFIRVEFASESVKMDRDFVVNVKYKDEFRSKGYLYSHGGGSFLQIDFHPAETELAAGNEPHSPHGKEVIFVLDCSGSMAGSSISQAKKALEVFLRGLTEGMRFNVYRFGSTFERLFRETAPYSPENLNRAVSYLDGVDANMGGTEVLAPLKEIYTNRAFEGHEREIILITDGEVGNEAEVMGLVENGDQGTRLFAIGIGYGPNEYFVRQLSRVAGGTAELVAPGERIEPKILRLFKKVTGQKIEGLKVSWGAETEQAPSRPVAFAGEGISLLAMTKEDIEPPEKLTLSARVGKEPREWVVPVQRIQGQEIPIPLLWARETIRDLEEGTSEPGRTGSRQRDRTDQRVREKIIALSRKFGILSRETSFVAIEKRAGDERTKEDAVLRKIPVLLTKGWGGVELRRQGIMPVAASVFMSPPHRIMRSLTVANASFDVPRVYQGQVKEPAMTGYDVLMKILSLQSVEGGFAIDNEAAEMMGMSLLDLKEIAQRIEVNSETDRLLLLSTALILLLLEKHYASMGDDWRSVIRKSEKWLKEELSRTEPRIETRSLLDWAADFSKNLKFNASAPGAAGVNRKTPRGAGIKTFLKRK
jgi:Ca-activated chloride channel homolog